MKKRNLQLQLKAQNDQIQNLKKKEPETDLLFQDLRNSYQRQAEILYLSKGTTAETEALESEQKQLTQVSDKVIGTKGKSKLKVILFEDGRMVSAYPIN